MANATLSLGEKSYLDQLAADIVSRGGLGDADPVQALEDAHARRREFATEILLQKTRRARAAKGAIRLRFWGEANRVEFISRQAFLDSSLRASEATADTDFRSI